MPTVDAIAEKIKRIGSKKINYGKQLKADSEISHFAINSDGCTVVGCIDTKTKMLIYNSNGDLHKQQDFDYYISAIGMSSDLIFSAYYQKSSEHTNYEQLRIVSYDFDLTRKNSFTNNISDPIYVFYSDIDVCNQRVYLKIGIKNKSKQNSQIIYVLDMKLNKIESFAIDEQVELYDIKVRSDYIAYCSAGANTYSFYVKSLKTKKLLNKLDLSISRCEYISFDTISNGNLYVLVTEESLVNEYDLFGKLVQSVRVDVAKSASNSLRMTDNFKFVVRSLDQKKLFLN